MSEKRGVWEGTDKRLCMATVVLARVYACSHDTATRQSWLETKGTYSRAENAYACAATHERKSSERILEGKKTKPKECI